MGLPPISSHKFGEQDVLFPTNEDFSLRLAEKKEDRHPFEFDDREEWTPSEIMCPGAS